MGSQTQNYSVPLVAWALALLVGVVAHVETAGHIREAELRAHRTRAVTLAEALGSSVLETRPDRGQSMSRRPVLEDARRLTCITPSAGRNIVAWSTSRDGKALERGTPMVLSELGNRAFRTGSATVEPAARGAGLVAYAPLRDQAGVVRGLLMLEGGPGTSLTGLTGFLNAWSLLVLPLLLAGGVGLWFILQVSQPLLLAREHLQTLGAVEDPQSDAAAADSVSGLVASLGHLSDRIGRDKSLFEARVRERTEHLEERARAKDEVISNIVHELRTPLSTIMASVDILQHTRQLTKDERNEFLEQANTACQHMKFLVNDILDSAAVESGMMRVDSGNCSLNQLLRDAERVMQPSAIAKCIELRLEVPDHEVGVSVDRGRVLQVLFNLLSNAIKYSPYGSSVTLRAEANSLAAVVEVEDSGDGVPASSRARLFTKFARLHRNNGQEVEGSGIGLYLSKKLVELMNGSIGYRSRDAEPSQAQSTNGAGEATAVACGSVFWFTLPLATEPLARPGSAGTASVANSNAVAAPADQA